MGVFCCDDGLEYSQEVVEAAQAQKEAFEAELAAQQRALQEANDELEAQKVSARVCVSVCVSVCRSVCLRSRKLLCKGFLAYCCFFFFVNLFVTRFVWSWSTAQVAHEALKADVAVRDASVEQATRSVDAISRREQQLRTEIEQQQKEIASLSSTNKGLRSTQRRVLAQDALQHLSMTMIERCVKVVVASCSVDDTFVLCVRFPLMLSD